LNIRRRSLTINFVISTTLAVIFGTAMTTTNSVWAATINCPNQPPVPPFNINCIGTDDPDNMLGTANQDVMNGREGNDRMFGFSSNDQMDGGPDDDTMSGGSGDDILNGFIQNDNVNGDSGDDEIIGYFGADILKGSSGNDRIFHFATDNSLNTRPDGSKDNIDCGSGIDEAWINTSQDGDTAISCETVHAG
jgi:Ca2+-binding RTX toxin-like protein